MDIIDEMRLNAGLPIRTLEERRASEKNKEVIAEGNEHAAKARKIASAIKHIRQAIRVLDSIPGSSTSKEVQKYIYDLKDCIEGGDAKVGLEDLRQKYETYSDDEEPVGAKEEMEYEEDSRDDEETPCGCEAGDEECEQGIVKEAAEPEGNEYGYNADMTSSGDAEDPNSVVMDKEPNALNYEPKDDGDKLPAGQDATVKHPKELVDSLKARIKELEAEGKEAYEVEQDELKYRSRMTAAEALKSVLAYLDKKTVLGMKEAQIFVNSWKSQFQHRLPDECYNYIMRGGPNRSLKDYYYEVKGQ